MNDLRYTSTQKIELLCNDLLKIDAHSNKINHTAVKVTKRQNGCHSF